MDYADEHCSECKKMTEHERNWDGTTLLFVTCCTCGHQTDAKDLPPF